MPSERPDELVSALKTYVYDTPDGEETFKKTLHSAKVTGFIGTMMGVYRVTLITPGPAIVNAFTLGRFILPAAAAGALFAVTTNTVAQYRGKDDQVNHFIGGAAAGALVGSRYKRATIPVTFGLGLAGGLLAAFSKEGAMAGKPFGYVDPNNAQRIGFTQQYYNYSYGAKPKSEYTAPENY